MTHAHVVTYNGQMIQRGDVVTLVPGARLKFTPKPGWAKAWYTAWGVSNINRTALPDADGTFDLGEMAAGKLSLNIADDTDGRTSGMSILMDAVFIEAASVKPEPLPQKSRWARAAIVDKSAADVNAAMAKGAGFNGIREWLGWDAAGNVDPAKIDKINAYVAQGMKVMAVLTPPTKASTVTYPSAAIAALKAKVNTGVIINVLNECNLAEYWPGGDRASAFAMAAKIAAELQGAGFRVGSPSFSWGPEALPGWYREAMTQLGGWPFDFTVVHAYPNYDANYPVGAVTTLQAIIDAAKIPGKPVIVDEWGFWPAYPRQTVLDLLPKFRAVLDADTWADAYFSAARIDKATTWPWAWNATTNPPTKAVDMYLAFQAVNR